MYQFFIKHGMQEGLLLLFLRLWICQFWIILFQQISECHLPKSGSEMENALLIDKRHKGLREKAMFRNISWYISNNILMTRFLDTDALGERYEANLSCSSVLIDLSSNYTTCLKCIFIVGICVNFQWFSLTTNILKRNPYFQHLSIAVAVLQAMVYFTRLALYICVIHIRILKNTHLEKYRIHHT